MNCCADEGVSVHRSPALLVIFLSYDVFVWSPVFTAQHILSSYFTLYCATVNIM